MIFGGTSTLPINESYSDQGTVLLGCQDSDMVEDIENGHSLNADIVKSNKCGTGPRKNRIRDKTICKKHKFSKKNSKVLDSHMMTMSGNKERQNMLASVRDLGNTS